VPHRPLRRYARDGAPLWRTHSPPPRHSNDALHQQHLPPHSTNTSQQCPTPTTVCSASASASTSLSVLVPVSQHLSISTRYSRIFPGSIFSVDGVSSFSLPRVALSSRVRCGTDAEARGRGRRLYASTHTLTEYGSLRRPILSGSPHILILPCTFASSSSSVRVSACSPLVPAVISRPLHRTQDARDTD